jgi:uncharacterized membrane protein
MTIPGLLLFAHILGFVLWLGVTFTLAAFTVRAAKSEDRDVVAFTYRAACHLLKGPGLVGMVLTLGSGIWLTVELGYSFFRPFPNHWLFQMQLLGTIAFLVAILYQIPLADRLARAAEARAAAGESSASFLKFRKRNGMVGSILGLLLLINLFLGAVRPGG